MQRNLQPDNNPTSKRPILFIKLSGLKGAGNMFPIFLYSNTTTILVTRTCGPRRPQRAKRFLIESRNKIQGETETGKRDLGVPNPFTST